jgi:predicted RNA-binding protein associated with RNAse of E/G family
MLATTRRYKQVYIEEQHFNGFMPMLYLDKVRQPLNVKYGTEEICIVNDGFMWLQQFPMEANHALTTVIDTDGKIVQWYFDIVNHFGVSEEGIPYFEDLFLDVVVLPNGHIHMLDEDELQEALQSGVITENMFQMAHQEANKLVISIEAAQNYLINHSDRYIDYMKQQI